MKDTTLYCLDHNLTLKKLQGLGVNDKELLKQQETDIRNYSYEEQQCDESKI